MNFTSATDFTGRTRWVYQELRDRKVALFIDHLPEGVWQLSYEMRAESPGAFHALPVLGHAMYVPEIRTNGAEVRIRVVDVAKRIHERVGLDPRQEPVVSLIGLFKPGKRSIFFAKGGVGYSNPVVHYVFRFSIFLPLI